MRMKKSMGRVIMRAVRIAALVVLAVLVLPVLLNILQSRQARVRLLSKTDHHALLEAGREILAEVANGNLNVGIYDLRNRTDLPSGIAIPRAIIDLGARRFDVSKDGHMMIEMHGGMDHFGVDLYAEDFREPYPDFKYGDRKLIDGLWYYDEQYQWSRDYGEAVERYLKRNPYMREGASQGGNGNSGDTIRISRTDT
jgi:hypothetical protein